MNKKIQILAVVVWAIAAASALAQPGGRGDGPPRWDRERIETIVIGKFAEELDLSPAQAERFFPRFRQFRDETEGLRESQRARMDKLDDLSHGSGGDQAELPKLLDEQQQAVSKLAELRRVFLADVSNYLTPQQVSRCAILMEEIPKRMHELMQKQGDGGHGRGQGGRRGPRGSN